LLPLGTRQVADDVVFFNFGYEEDPPMALPLAASDEPNRFCIQLDHLTANPGGSQWQMRAGGQLREAC
jgi:hypothetical protein